MSITKETRWETNAGEEEDSLANNCSLIMWVQFCMEEGADTDDHLPIITDGWFEYVSVKPCMSPC